MWQACIKLRRPSKHIFFRLPFPSKYSHPISQIEKLEEIPAATVAIEKHTLVFKIMIQAVIQLGSELR